MVFLNTLIFLYMDTALAAFDMPAQKSLGLEDVLRWGLALIFVLTLFFICVFLLKKTDFLKTVNSEQNEMKILSRLSVGEKEQLILIKLGKKQLLLAVSPGTVKVLSVLEGDECLNITSSFPQNTQTVMQSLLHIMKVNNSR